jgi:hypothetical protein
MTAKPELPKPAILRGTRAIGAYLGMSDEAALWGIKKGVIPAAKVGKCWSASIKALDALVPQAPPGEPAKTPEPDPVAQTAAARKRRWPKRKLLAPANAEGAP